MREFVKIGWLLKSFRTLHFWHCGSSSTYLPYCRLRSSNGIRRLPDKCAKFSRCRKQRWNAVPSMSFLDGEGKTKRYDCSNLDQCNDIYALPRSSNSILQKRKSLLWIEVVLDRNFRSGFCQQEESTVVWLFEIEFCNAATRLRSENIIKLVINWNIT